MCSAYPAVPQPNLSGVVQKLGSASGWFRKASKVFEMSFCVLSVPPPIKR